MSANSQAAGNNHVELNTLAVTSSLWVCSWVKVNGWDKAAAYGISLVAGGGAVAAGFIQGAGGTGTEDRLDGFWYNGGFNASNNLVSTSGVWKFLMLGVSGTTNAAISLRIGDANGPLTNVSLTSNFSAATFTYILLCGDTAGSQSAFQSVRHCRAWVDTSFTLEESTRERDSSTGAPVKTTGLISWIPLPNGSNPGTAATGANWDEFGTFTTDASDPSPAPGAPPGLLGGGTRDLLTGRLPHLRMSEQLERERRLRRGGNAAEVVRASRRAQQRGRAFSFLSAP